MEEIIRNVRDIDAADREALGHMVGRELRENQQVIIGVVNLDAAADLPEEARPAKGKLPDWCNVYEGLTDAEIDDVEKSIIRTQGRRGSQTLRSK